MTIKRRYFRNSAGRYIHPGWQVFTANPVIWGNLDIVPSAEGDIDSEGISYPVIRWAFAVQFFGRRWRFWHQRIHYHGTLAPDED